MPRVHKTKGTLGRNLMKAIEQKNHSFQPKTVDAPRFVHAENNQAQLDKGKDLKSCIDQDNLDDFLQVVQLQNKHFEALRGMKLKMDMNDREVVIDANKDKEAINDAAFNIENNQYIQNLRIPRKPKWTKEMTKDQLNSLENQSFVEWRKALAKIEEAHYTIQITPYEKNVEVWKQLWRVIERSDIIVQIVDGRDPLFFRCPDVEVYSKEVNPDKLNFLLINKSDLISDDIRKEWSTYFNEQNVQHMFFSAKMEQEKIDANHAQEVKNNVFLTKDLGLNDEDEEEKKNQENEKTKQYLNTPNICNRETLLRTLKQLVQSVKQKKNLIKQKKEQDSVGNEHLEDQLILDQLDEAENMKFNKQKMAIQIGMVGYPNVGKSSVINTLCNKKLVGVGSLPGKTKNFQTHFLEQDLILCDCPGLVFPNAASTRAEMVCNGVMPIDKLKDYLSPVDLLCSRIPKIVLEKLYKIKIDVEVPDGSYFLSKYAVAKGYYTGSGVPDMAKSSKLILKELVSGKLLYCKLPPTCEENCGIWQSNQIDIQVGNILGDVNEQEQEEKAENMEAYMVNEEERKLDQMLLKQETQKIGDKMQFDEDDIVFLLAGKKVNGIKLNKQQKRDIKFAYQRGEVIDMKKYLSQDQILEFGIKNKGMIPPSS
ncbi:hypothetical protein ABPG74_001241 [Tetrahymena malaccensis]